jgi:hypothetical protein
MPDLVCTVRGCLLASAGVSGRCYSLGTHRRRAVAVGPAGRACGPGHRFAAPSTCVCCPAPKSCLMLEGRAMPGSEPRLGSCA